MCRWGGRRSARQTKSPLWLHIGRRLVRTIHTAPVAFGWVLEVDSICSCRRYVPAVNQVSNSPNTSSIESLGHLIVQSRHQEIPVRSLSLRRVRRPSQVPSKYPHPTRIFFSTYAQGPSNKPYNDVEVQFCLSSPRRGTSRRAAPVASTRTKECHCFCCLAHNASTAPQDYGVGLAQIPNPCTGTSVQPFRHCHVSLLWGILVRVASRHAAYRQKELWRFIVKKLILIKSLC